MKKLATIAIDIYAAMKVLQENEAKDLGGGIGEALHEATKAFRKSIAESGVASQIDIGIEMHQGARE